MADDETGGVKLPVATFLELLRHTRRQEPPYGVTIESLRVTGTTEKEHAKMTLVFDVLVLCHEGGICPLIPTEGLAVTHTAVDTEGAVVGIVQSDLAVITKMAGRVRVTIEGNVRYANRQMRSVQLDLKEALRNEIVFTIAKEDVNVKFTPSLQAEIRAGEPGTTVAHATFPPTRSLTIQWIGAKVETENESVEEEPEKPEVKKEQVTVVQQCLCSIGEGILAAHMEFFFDIVNGTRSLLEILVDRRMRILQVEGPGVKRWELVDASPEGHIPPPVASEPPPAASPEASGPREGEGEVAVVQPVEGEPAGEPASNNLLRVHLDYAIDGGYRLQVTGEVEMESTSCQVAVPVIICRGVSREKGFIGVEARTNVEINEEACMGVQRVDITELPQELRDHSTNPLLLGYKFLNTEPAIELDVKRHADVNVLIAVVDEAWFEATFSEGSILHRVLLKTRNTQKQFVAFSLPDSQKESEIWSTVVSGKAVKPARDEEKRVLIPLEKSSEGGDKTSFDVELVYLAANQKMGKEGTIQVSFAGVDLPINHAFFAIYLPETHRYGEFEGALKEVPHFSEVMRPSTSAPGWAGKRGRGLMQTRITNRASGSRLTPDAPFIELPEVSGQGYMNNYNDEEEEGGEMEDVMEELEEEQMDFNGRQELYKSLDKVTRGGKAKTSGFGFGFGGGAMRKRERVGMVPVKIDRLQVGRQFCFEKLLVTNEEETVTVEYYEKKKKKARRISSSCSML